MSTLPRLVSEAIPLGAGEGLSWFQALLARLVLQKQQVSIGSNEHSFRFS